MTLIDTATPFGQRVQRRLQSERVIWLTTVRRDGLPQPSPVWFLFQDDEFLIWSQPKTQKLRNIAGSPLVSLNLDGNGQGGDIVVFSGEAAVDESVGPADQIAAYVARYETFIAHNGWTPASFAADYSVPVRVRATALRGH